MSAKNLNRKTPIGGSDFEDLFWKPYFRGKGVSRGSKQKAISAWDARIKEGVSVEDIVAGLKRALSFHRILDLAHDDPTAYRFMPHAHRFLSPELAYWEQPWQSSPWNLRKAEEVEAESFRLE